MTKTHTMRVDEEYWLRCAEYAEAAAEPGETPNVSAAVRRALRIGLEAMDRRLLHGNTLRLDPSS